MYYIITVLGGEVQERGGKSEKAGGSSGIKIGMPLPMPDLRD